MLKCRDALPYNHQEPNTISATTMFVRWKKRTLAPKNGSTTPERSLYAVIVKNQRIEGQTRQKVVKYLAHINEALLADPLHQSHFWERAEQGLAELQLEPALKKEIEKKLAATVARPTEPLLRPSWADHFTTSYH